MSKREVLEKEIELIQNCITRMGQNSFNIKGWLIALIIAVIALFPENVNVKYVCLIIGGISLIFWYLDAFFLKTEKLYRWKYDWVIAKRLTIDEYYYNLNPYEKNMWLLNDDQSNKKEPCVIKIMFTKTLIPFYMPIILIALFAFAKVIFI